MARERRRLHIGGVQAAPGWEIFNITYGPHVDHVGNAKDLSRFEDNTFSAIYASHVLEHFDYNGELSVVLNEWFLVLAPRGRLYVSVPDLDVLAYMFADKDLFDCNDRLHIMLMIFGGHCDANDFHRCGLNAELLSAFLAQAGFTGIQRVESLNQFHDTSDFKYKGIAISLSLIAEKP